MSGFESLTPEARADILAKMVTSDNVWMRGRGVIATWLAANTEIPDVLAAADELIKATSDADLVTMIKADLSAHIDAIKTMYPMSSTATVWWCSLCRETISVGTQKPHQCPDQPCGAADDIRSHELPLRMGARVTKAAHRMRFICLDCQKEVDTADDGSQYECAFCGGGRLR